MKMVGRLLKSSSGYGYGYGSYGFYPGYGYAGYGYYYPYYGGYSYIGDGDCYLVRRRVVGRNGRVFVRRVEVCD